MNCCNLQIAVCTSGAAGARFFQLAQLGELRHQLGRITGRAVFLALLVFTMRGRAAHFLDLGGKARLFGLVKCVKFHRCHSCFQSLTGEGAMSFPSCYAWLQFDLVFQRGRLVRVRII